MTNGYSKTPHMLWDLKLTMEEKVMLCYLLDCENRFNKENDWFSLSDDDFIERCGFGKNKAVLRRTRNSLIDKEFIEYIKGSFDKKSQYKVTHKYSTTKVQEIKG